MDFADKFRQLREETKAFSLGSHLLNQQYISLPVELVKTQPEPQVLAQFEKEIVFLAGSYGDDVTGLTQEQRELLEKMAKAMTLNTSEYEIIDFFDESDVLKENKDLKRIEDVLQKTRPKVMVTLGSEVTNIVLEKEERISQLRGTFFEKRFAPDLSIKVVPIFHPGLLIINPNMKRTTWLDLQKIMDYLERPLT